MEAAAAVMIRSEESPATSLVQAQAQPGRFKSFGSDDIYEGSMDVMRTLQPTHDIIKSLKDSFQSSSSSSTSLIMSHLSINDRPVFPQKAMALSRATVWGRLYYTMDNVEYDCSDIPVRLPHPYKTHHWITSMHTDDASFILLVEKNSPFYELGNFNFFDEFPCILLRCTGDPDDKTEPFLWKMKQFMNLPVLAFVDWDPKGLKLLHMLKQKLGPLQLDLLWLGFRFHDFEKYKLPQRYMVRMKKEDYEMAKELKQDESFQKNRALADELDIMLKTKRKAESEVVYAGGFKFLNLAYLPLKLQNQDWERL